MRAGLKGSHEGFGPKVVLGLEVMYVALKAMYDRVVFVSALDR